MEYTKKQPKPNFQEPVFMPKVQIVESGIIREFGKWTLDEDGLLTIEGTGRMPDWDSRYDVPWLRAREQIKSLQIADTVTTIGDYAFYGCDGLESIWISGNVTKIGKSAFASCSFNRPDVILGAGNTLHWSVHPLRGLTEVNIDFGVTCIETKAFCSCTMMTSITIPNSVTKIGKKVFSHCESLRHVKMPKRFDRFRFESYYGISKIYVEFY